jgi:heptosyltransferase-2
MSSDASFRLIVFSPNWLGDAVMALPAIEDLRRHLNARVTVAARRSVASLFSLVPHVDDIVELEWRGRIGEMAAMRQDIKRLRAVRADAALLLPNSFASAWLAGAARIPQRWGYARDGRSLLLTRAIELPHVGRVRSDPPNMSRGQPPSRSALWRVRRSLGECGRAPAYAGPPEGGPHVRPSPQPRAPSPGIHQGAYYQHLTHALGAPNGPLEPRVGVSSQALDAGRALLTSAGWDSGRPLVVFAPGAAYGTAKQWWPTHYAQLAGDLVSQQGVSIALVGSRGDAEATGEVMGLLPSPARPAVLDLAGRTTLEQLAAVLSVARVCVSNDSGAMHLAAALGTPLAAIFGPTNEHETSPLAHAPTELLIEPVACRPCMLRECPIDHPCMRDLTPDRVFTSVTRLLDPADGRRRWGMSQAVP